MLILCAGQKDKRGKKPGFFCPERNRLRKKQAIPHFLSCTQVFCGKKFSKFRKFWIAETSYDTGGSKLPEII